MTYNPFHSVNANYHSTKRKRNKKPKFKNTTRLPARKPTNKISRIPNNNPSTRGKQMK